VGGGGATIGTALPGSPADGQEAILVDSLTAPTYAWRFRYLAAKASNRWLFIGGAPLLSEVATPDNVASASYVSLATPGPSVAIPVAGDYQVAHGFQTPGTTSGPTLFMSYDIGATAANDADATQNQGVAGNGVSVAMRTRPKALTAVALVSKYKGSTATSVSLLNRWLSVVPVAVGG